MREMIKRKEWLGDIPSKWGYIPGKYAFKLRTSKGNSTPILLAATQKQGMYPQHLLEGVVQVQEGTDMQTFKTVHINDYVISLRSFQGGFEMSDYEGVCSPAYQVFYNTKPIDHRYFKYLFKCKGFIQEMDSVTVGIREGKNIPYNSFGQTYIPFPSLPEQSRIATFLDERCAKIDEAVAWHKALIEKLDEYRKAVIAQAVTKGVKGEREMKESGVDWIGKIPVDWILPRIKDHFTIISGSGFKEELQGVDNGECPICKASDISNAGHHLTHAVNYLSFSDAKKAGFSIIPKGSIIFPKIGEAMKKNNRSLTMIDCCVDNNCQGLIPHDINSEYSYYFLSIVNMSWFDNAGTIPCLNNQKLRNSRFAYPSVSEQVEIVAFLDKKCAAIDSAKERHKQLMAKLEEYKKSLIYNAVTGKIEC